MAWRGGGQFPTQNRALQGIQTTNGDSLPPPSTLAAQIVHSRSNVARQEPENKALFGKLLQEYLKDPVLEEANVETNAQLISVVAEAGLDVLLKDDPFAPDALLQQASDSLLVIQLTIKRTPEVLLFNSDDLPEEKQKPPLLLWLLPKILSLYGRRNMDAIQETLHALLIASVQSLLRGSQLWRQAALVQDILKAVVEDLLSALENQRAEDGRVSPSINVYVPSPSCMLAFWPNACNALVLPQGYQAHICGPFQAQMMVLGLLSVLRECERREQPKITSLPTTAARTWAIDCCQRILNYCRSSTEISASERDKILGRVCRVGFEVFPIQCSKCKAGPLIDLLAELLRDFEPCDTSQLREQLESCLHDLFSPNQYPAVIGECRRRLLPLVKEIAEDPTSLSKAELQQPLNMIGEFFHLKERQAAASDTRPSKRQRIGDTELDSWDVEYDHYARRLTALLTGQSRSYVVGLEGSAVEQFNLLDQEEKCLALCTIGMLPCAATHCSDSKVINGERSRCKVCDCIHSISPSKRWQTWNEMAHNKEYPELITFLSALIENPDFRRSRKPRILAANAIRRIMSHLSDPDILSLGPGGFGPWLMRSLQSSLRELRIVSAQALVTYLREDLPEAVRTKNRLEMLDFLKCLTDRNSLSEQETLVATWGLIGRTCGEAELNLALIQLIDFLGHTHSLICGVAYHEILRLAEGLGRTPLDLFKPFWSSIATHVLKDLITRPQKAQQLSDLLGISVNDLLLRTQTDTVPYLLLARKKEVLQRIAQARGPTTGVQDLWLQPPKNLAAVLSLLLVQQSPDVEQAAISLFQDAAPDFNEAGLSAMVKVDPILIACEILKHAGDYQDAKKAQAHQGLRLLALLAERKPGQSKAVKPTKVLSSFFEAHILGIMSHFTDIIDSAMDKQPLAEKKRSIKAIEQLIVLAKSHVGMALPQIRATLQSAFQVQQLVDCSFLTWATLVAVTGEEDIESLIDHTFSIIVQNWASFNAQTQHRAHDTIADMLKNHNNIIRDRIEMIPSLEGITLLQKFDGEINRFKAALDPMIHFEAFSRRCNDENSAVVHQALKELVPFLNAHQRIIHESAISQQPHVLIAKISRSLLEASIRFKETHPKILDLCGQSLGIIGSIDPNRVDSSRKKREILMLSNFEKANEVIDFVAHMLETVIVEAFHSASTGKAQTYLAYVIQELLKFCGFRKAVMYRPKSSQSSPTYYRWVEITESVRSTLTPYFSTKYVIVHPAMPVDGEGFPIFKASLNHGVWLRTLVFNLLHKAKGENAQMVFPVLSRVIWGHDIAIPTFLLPFVVLNIVVGGTDPEVESIRSEFLAVLAFDIDTASQTEAEHVKQCSENIFQVLDYLSRWLQEKKKVLNEVLSGNSRTTNVPADFDEIRDVGQISSVERILSGIPADIISRRAVQCRSYARALFHWEQHIRQTVERANLKKEPANMEDQFKHLQHIYAQIDEPDAVEGISTRLQILDPEQQVLEHKRAGRWSAAQSWYELSLSEKPGDQSLQMELLACLKGSGRYGPLLDTVRSLATSSDTSLTQAIPFAAEASWVTGKWKFLEQILTADTGSKSQHFNANVGRAFLALRRKDIDIFKKILSTLREDVVRGLSASSTASLAAAHPYTVKLHALYELEQISGLAQSNLDRESLIECLDRRLDVLGAFTDDKQYLLGIRRAAMEVSSLNFTKQQIGSAWLTSARLNRKAGLTDAAYDAVLHATQLQDGAAKIEHSRLLWRDGHYRKAIQNLQGAIETNVFQSYSMSTIDEQTGTTDEQQKQQNLLVAKTQLLLAKWIDRGGQSKSDDIRAYYLQAVKSFSRWEKGHYYMGRHYLKIFESEKATPRAKQTDAFLTGDCQKLVIDNFMRSMVFGSKYHYQTVPKMLTLWLDLGAELHAAEQHPRSLDPHYHGLKVKKLEVVNRQVKKYFDRLPAYVFYTALPQIMSRINHPHPKVAELVTCLINKICSAYPQQALWSLLAVAKAKANDKSSKANLVLNQLKRKGDSSGVDLKALIVHGQKLTEHLLRACEVAVDSRSSHVSLQRDLAFSHKLAPCQLVVPVEKTLTATLPTGTGGQAIMRHKPFPRSTVTISSFQDDVLVLSSLQRPRKLTIRGSDGESYGLLCKPKDDLRKDQRLMEFTSMIDRSLKRDVESSKRGLYIRTYAVTPLNEECGAIEWVDGLKPMRDIILANYKTKGVRPDYGELRQLLDRACADPDAASWKIFTDQVLPKFPAVLYEWFIETFAEPESWLTARLRYTRSCAVMSMVGHALGLGDRHGENILLEEHNGGVFHVDFNCLFDKGLTFEKPELVPFRLTHNMVDAMGVYGYEGPFRTAAELTLKILRQYEDTLMTIMETFLHDPTTDFIAKPKKRVVGVPETPGEVLESVRAKVRGLLQGETVPLSVDGYVDAVVRMAVEPRRLAGMYIGWCAFF